jgi:hypothetical protein
MLEPWFLNCGARLLKEAYDGWKQLASKPVLLQTLRRFNFLRCDKLLPTDRKISFDISWLIIVSILLIILIIN